MSRTLVIPDQLYDNLDAAARTEGLGSVEELLTKLASVLPRGSRRRAGERISNLRERLQQKYGQLSDSTPLIREDRER
jgi:hypothetical protein